MSAGLSAEARVFRRGTVELSGPVLSYVECGRGRPVVFLHGYTDSWH